jgi:IS1 family transposase
VQKYRPLTLDQKAKIISHLCEGASIRSTERLTGHHRDSVMNLGVVVGEGCVAIHQRLMTGLHVAYVELDEAWSFVKKRRERVTEEDPDTVGDQFIFIALDATSRAILTWHIGKRTSRNTMKFVADLRTRLINDPSISTDGFPAYRNALDHTFEDSPHGIVSKETVVIAAAPDADKYYAREAVVRVERMAAAGEPQRISTSYIERQNLTLRQSQRRFTRLANGFSKKFRNHCAAVSLYATFYNLCRIHESLRVTPAMHLGVTDRVWSAEDLVEAALSRDVQAHLFAIKGRFHVIQGGRA